MEKVEKYTQTQSINCGKIISKPEKKFIENEKDKSC